MGLSEDFKKFLTGQKNKVCEQGQAVIEYILFLIIIVSIILGILYQFNDTFKNFLHNYFGNYIACLLETGELPSLGGEGGANQDSCNAKFKNFDISSGRSILDPATNRNAPEISGISGPGGDNNDSSGDGKGSENDPSSGDGPSQGQNASLRPGRFNKTKGPANGDGGKLSDRPTRQTLKLNNNAQGGDDSKEKSNETTLGVGVRGGRRIVRRRVMMLDEEYFTEDEKKKKEKTVNKGKQITKGKGSVSNLRKPRFDLKLPEPPKPEVEDKGLKFSFGFFLKFLIIAGIVIGIFFFLGGQVLQIKKSWQK